MSLEITVCNASDKRNMCESVKLETLRTHTYFVESGKKMSVLLNSDFNPDLNGLFLLNLFF